MPVCLLKIRYKTKEPLWEDCLSFLVHNPRRQELELEVRPHRSLISAGSSWASPNKGFPPLLGGAPYWCLHLTSLFPSQVKDDKHKCTLGNLTVPLNILLAEEDMTLTRCFPLRNSGPSSTVKLKMALRVRGELGCMADAAGAQINQDFRRLEEFQK